MLVYGRPGAGKTTFAASAQDHPAMKNVLFINVEGGLLSIAHRSDIMAVDCKSIVDLDAVFWAIINRDQVANSAFKGINTVVLDSGTELQTFDLENIVREEVASKRNAKRTSDDEIWREDYGKNTNRMKRALRGFRDAQINFIVTALPKSIMASSESSTPVEVVPWFTSKLGDALQGYMDMVFYMYRDETGKRSIITSDAKNPSGTWYRAKTRGQRFADHIGQIVENPSLPELYELFVTTESGKKAPAKVATKETQEAKA
jgi:hypothetical protein